MRRRILGIVVALSLAFIILVTGIAPVWAQQVVWTRQFGSSENDFAWEMAVNGSSVYVVGETLGALPGQTYNGLNDAFVCRYDIYGNLIWTRQFGTSGLDKAKGVSVSGSGVYVAGWTTGTLPGQTSSGSYDVFVCKYDVYGNLEWTRQFGTPDMDWAEGVAVSGSSVYVVGETWGALSGQTNKGLGDVFVRKYDVYGNLKWTCQFGSSSDDYAQDVEVGGSGVYVAGQTYGALPGQTYLGSFDGFVCKYDNRGNLEWIRQFGTSEHDDVYGVSVHGRAVYVAGETHGTLPGQTYQGGDWDAFVCQYDIHGNLRWARQFGTAESDSVSGVAVYGSGVYVAGRTAGALPGQTYQGTWPGSDAFVCRYTAYGNLEWTRQFGTSADDGAADVSVNYYGVYVAGATDGAIGGQTNQGGYDVFVCRYYPQ